MKITIPKGSYHEHCRNKSSAKSGQRSHRIGIGMGKDGMGRGEAAKMEHFDNFEKYLMFLQQKDQLVRDRFHSQTERPYRASTASRPHTQQLRRPVDLKQPSKQKESLIKPFFPFYRCRIESASSPSRDGKFRISSKRLKLNYRIIQQNMGKGECW